MSQTLVRVDEITWALSPLERPQDADLSTLAGSALRDDVAGLLVEMQAVREVLHAAVALTHEQHAEITRLSKRVIALLKELRPPSTKAQVTSRKRQQPALTYKTKVQTTNDKGQGTSG